MTKKQWHFALHKNGQTFDQTVEFSHGKILYNNVLHDSLTFSEQESFTLFDVCFGETFHFSLTESQTFIGDLQFLVVAEGIVAVNILPVEEYLKSVISSEMNADCPLELLKAHTIISRSWLLHNSQSPHPDAGQDLQFINSNLEKSKSQSSKSYIKWYERDAHRLFDVCAGDHCQRYLGITRQLNPNVEKAVKETENEVLSYFGDVCDTRFHKCCGGKTEVFRYVWADAEVPYLQSVDCPYCRQASDSVLRRVLNTFDAGGLKSAGTQVSLPATNGTYYQWQVEYSQAELSELVKRKSGIDFGTITALIPIERGLSGRISKLKIVGTKKTLIVGKELEIRYWLADTCLYSSNFEVETSLPHPARLRCARLRCENLEQYLEQLVSGPPSPHPDAGQDLPHPDAGQDFPLSSFLLKGKGWGHGVGLCQIGAAVMAERGFDYRQILHHYFPKSIITSYC